MEVRREPAIYVKAKLVDTSQATLHLTRVDQIFKYYYPCILFYKGSCSNVDGEEDEMSKNAERDNALALRAVRRGVEAMVEHYPWAAGRLCTVKKIHSSQCGEEEQECLQVCINEDGGPGVEFVVAFVNRSLHSLGDLSDPNPAFEPLFANVDQNAPYHSRPLVALQVSRFECGGFCVSMNANHALSDGFAASMFLQNMGSYARGRGLCLPLELGPRELRIYPRNNHPPPKLCCSFNVVHKKDFKPLTAKQVLFSTPLVATKFVFKEHDLVKP